MPYNAPPWNNYSFGSFTPSDWKNLHAQSPVDLELFGMRRWNVVDDPESLFPKGCVLWLFPTTAYKHIPNGFKIVTISNEVKTFKRKAGQHTQDGETDDDHRCGLLAFGVLKQTDPTVCRECNGQKEIWQVYCGAACAAQAGA